MMNNCLHEQSNPNPIPKSYRNKKEEEDEMFMRAMGITTMSVYPMVLKTTFELGIIDAIFAAGEGAWLSPAEIASRLPIKPTNPQAPLFLDRMLRVLASHSLLKCRVVRNGETQFRVYGAEPICKFFLNDVNGDSGSLVSLFMMHHDDVMMESGKYLKGALLDARDTIGSAHGMSLFEYLDSDEQLREMFNRSMSQSTVVVMKRVLEVYNGFEEVNVLVDVGGGYGTALRIVTSKYPKMKCINFDSAAALSNARPYPGVEHIAGDMFVDIPKGDAIFMKRILHDWSDEECVKILKNCGKSLPEKGKVIVVEIVLPDELKSDDVYSNVAFEFDMLMSMHTFVGRERTQAEFEDLAISSGFDRCECVCRVSPYSVIEFHK